MKLPISVLGLVALFGPSPGRASDDFLFVIAEDQSAFRYGSGVRPNPTASLERLAGGGMVFRQAYCPATVCNSSRTALLTCRPPDQTGIFKNTDDPRKLPTVLHHLKANGYDLKAVGKIFHNGYEQDDVFSIAENPKPQGKANIEFDNGGPGTLMQIGVSKDGASEDGAALKADVAIRFIRDADPGRKNGFLVGFISTHLPFFVPDSRRYAEAYDWKKIRLPVGDWFERPFATARNKKYRMPMYRRKQTIARHNGCLRYLSDQAARVIRAFQEKFPDGHVAFTSDHGFLLDEGRNWGKPSTMEAAARVPYFVWSKQLPAGEIDGPISTGTAFPLLLDLCGVPEFSGAHWRSPRKAIAGNRRSPPGPVFTYAGNPKKFRETRGNTVFHFKHDEKYVSGLDDRPLGEHRDIW